MKRRKATPAKPTRDTLPLVIIVYVLTLSLFLLAPYLPTYLNWGVRAWSYLPDLFCFTLFAVGFLAIPVAVYAARREGQIGQRTERSLPLWAFAILIAAFGSAFYFLRSQAHFLGDGYFQISNIASANPLIKSRDYGESMVHLLTRKFIGGDSADAALAAYRYLSIIAGAAFVVCAAWSARRLYVRHLDQLLFFLITATGGYALLYFGYVENYSLLALAIGAFTLCGLVACCGRLSGYWVLLPLAFAAFFHVVGLVLVPAAAYVVFTCSPALQKGASRLGRGAKSVAVGLILALGVAAFAYLYTTSYYFRFAFLPLFENRFTVEGYTLFSARHVFDFFNLLLMLSPGLLVFLAVSFTARGRKSSHTPEYVFLAVLVLSTLGAAFVFDPKLGMPRDWDLFSFPGIPLTALVALLALRGWSGHALATGVLVAVLQLLSLIPRALVLNDRESAITQVREYFDLDVLKSRSGVAVLEKQYLQRGDESRHQEMSAIRASRYPWEEIARQGQVLIQQSQVNEARVNAARLIAANPAEPAGWQLLARCYYKSFMADSAIEAYRISDGLNPYNYDCVYELGAAYRLAKNVSKARAQWQHAIRIDSTRNPAYWLLAQSYRLENPKSEEYGKYLRLAAGKKDAPNQLVKEFADFCLSRGEYSSAAEAYRRALEKGADTNAIRDSASRHPELGEVLSP
jgi:tetratricopeptide (TPR) repeat protein